MSILNSLRRVPPDPQVLAQIYADYLRVRKRRKKLTFKEYMHEIGLSKESEVLKGRDEGRRMRPAGGAALVQVPDQPVRGELRVMVLLVDFSDKKGARPPQEYEEMLFSKGTFLTGSMSDFYKEISKGKVRLTGSVHGWLRMPKPYKYYLGSDSGTGDDYPNNAQKLAEDAVNAAIAKKVKFPEALDKFDMDEITALFIVHAGRGAEQMSKQLQERYIWSHKADLDHAVEIRNGLFATTYLTVPEDCRMGVCAHELGHLAFQWDDFYDPDYGENGNSWAGAGNWDLMAGGSWNNGGNTPAHPAGLHKTQHDWVKIRRVDQSAKGVRIPPYNGRGATIVEVKSKAYSDTQRLVIENRARQGFDSKLPGEGLLVWRVDTENEMNTSRRPAMLLLQADGRHDMDRPDNDGDAGDPFPGKDGKKVTIADAGSPNTSFSTRKKSGIKISNILIDKKGVAKFDVTIK